MAPWCDLRGWVGVKNQLSIDGSIPSSIPSMTCIFYLHLPTIILPAFPHLFIYYAHVHFTYKKALFISRCWAYSYTTGGRTLKRITSQGLNCFAHSRNIQQIWNHRNEEHWRACVATSAYLSRLVWHDYVCYRSIHSKWSGVFAFHVSFHVTTPCIVMHVRAYSALIYIFHCVLLLLLLLLICLLFRFIFFSSCSCPCQVLLLLFSENTTSCGCCSGKVYL